MKSQKLIIYLALLLDMIGIAVMIPAFPELKAYYGINDFQVTLGLTIYSLCAFLAAPLLGQWSDKIGRKTSLVWCVAGTALSYLVLLLTKQYRIFLLSRVINGITGGNISILQAILTDISPTPQEKAKNFGIMGAFFGLGFIIGPIFGSLLLRFGGVNAIFLFGTVFALIEVALLAGGFVNTNILQPSKHIVYNSFTVMRKYLTKPRMKHLLWSLGFLGIGGFTINASQSLYMQNLFGTTGEQYGYYLAVAGILSGLNMALLVPKFWLQKFTPKGLIYFVHSIMILGYILVGLSHNLIAFLGFFYATLLLGNSYMPVYNMQIMSQAKPDEIGEVSGMLGGLQSLFMFIGPLIGGILLNFRINIFIGAVIAFAISMLIIARYLMKNSLTYTHKHH